MILRKMRNLKNEWNVFKVPITKIFCVVITQILFVEFEGVDCGSVLRKGQEKFESPN